jgi:general L-amino acid transport system permease protein
MAMAIDTPKQKFRLGMLIYDTRYRAITIQVIVLILFLLFVAWLADNTRHNLAIKGKDIDFSFLWRRSGYDIGQHLIPYTNDSTHFTAGMVGLINTLVVAALGCIFSTVLGVVFGVLRLSKNWIVSRLMTVYVEMFRNVPLLLWIILVYVILGETRPEPKDFKVINGVAKVSMNLWDSVAITNRGTNLPMPLLDHPLPGNYTTALAIVVFIIGSVWVNRILLRRARVIQEATGLRPVTWWKSLVLLVLPTTTLLMLMGFHLEYPVFKGFNFSGGINVAHAFTALLVALTLYYASVTAEIVRSGIQAISKGQSEASAALGLRPGRTMNLVILPQALRVIIPPMISQWLSLTKDTSLGIAVSYLDLRGTLGGITLNQTGRELECMLLMMLIYLIISLIISAIANAYNASVKLKER